MSESSIWICPECEVETKWSMKDVADKGTPVCSTCDCDMKLKDEEESEEVEEKSSYELMQNFIDDGRLHFESEQSIESLNKIANQLGYEAECFRYGSSFERFIADNPGCCQAIIDWIIKYIDRVPEWKESMTYIEDEEESKEEES